MEKATKKWIFLKVSSVILIPLMLWFVINLVSFYDKSFEEVLIFFTTQPTKFLFSLLKIISTILVLISVILIGNQNYKIKNTPIE